MCVCVCVCVCVRMHQRMAMLYDIQAIYYIYINTYISLATLFLVSEECAPDRPTLTRWIESFRESA